MYQLTITKANNKYELHACMMNRDNHERLLAIEKSSDSVVCELSSISIHFIVGIHNFALSSINEDPKADMTLDPDRIMEITKELYNHFTNNSFKFYSICLN
jgi:hypothetical protein